MRKHEPGRCFSHTNRTMSKLVRSKSKTRIIQLLNPPTRRQGCVMSAPKHLTVRRLIHHARYRKLRDQWPIARTSDNNLLSIGNLINLGFDYCG